jgi:UDP-N-acetylglucosamine 1-carboxyvinyltransferase
LGAVIAKLREAGCIVDVGADRLSIEAAKPLKPVDIAAQPYPGIPSDIQAQWTAALAVAQGCSRVRDHVFTSRFRHVAELHRLGARIDMVDGAAVVTGVQRLSGAPVVASDLRASAALVLAGLSAEGETIVAQSSHLDRGYQRLDAKLAQLGGILRRQRISHEDPLPSPDPHQRSVTPT